jgi:hypothetical protein
MHKTTRVAYSGLVAGISISDPIRESSIEAQFPRCGAFLSIPNDQT